MNHSLLDDRAKILDLERRVDLLERGLYGHSAPQCGASLLTRCYLEAHRALRKIEPEKAGTWVAVAYLLDVRALVALGRYVNDPYPYRPFLAVLDICALHSVPSAFAARTHLESVAQDLLTAQGLELIRPRDTMGRLRLHEALSRLKKT